MHEIIETSECFDNWPVGLSLDEPQQMEMSWSTLIASLRLQKLAKVFSLEQRFPTFHQKRNHVANGGTGHFDSLKALFVIAFQERTASTS